MPSPNVPLWHKDNFELKVLLKKTAGTRAESPPFFPKAGDKTPMWTMSSL